MSNLNPPGYTPKRKPKHHIIADMKSIRYISTAIKLLGAVGFVTQFLDAKTAAMIVLGASIAKDALASAGDLLDDGQRNNSFKA